MSTSSVELTEFDRSTTWSILELMLIEFIRAKPELYKIAAIDQIPQEVIEECSELLNCNVITVKKTWQSLRNNYSYYVENKNNPNLQNCKYGDGKLSFWLDFITKEKDKQEVMYTVTLDAVRNWLKTKYSTNVDELDNETLISPSIQAFADKLIENFHKESSNQPKILKQNLSQTEVVVKTEGDHLPSIQAITKKIVEDHESENSNLSNTLIENHTNARELDLKAEEQLDQDEDSYHDETVDEHNEFSVKLEVTDIFCEDEGPSTNIIKPSISTANTEPSSCGNIQDISKELFLEIYNTLNDEDFFGYLGSFLDEYPIEKKIDIVAKMWNTINAAESDTEY